MELPSQDTDIPIPINSSFGGGHGGHLIHQPQQHDPSSAIASHNNHINLPRIPSNGPPPQPPPPPPPLEEPQPQHQHVMPYKKVVVKYKECLKNHAAAMGGTAMDGCGEFMPSGEEGTIEALTCSACNCHRNFHRKEVEGGGDDHEHQWYNQTPPHNLLNKAGRKFILGHQIHPKNVNVLGGHEPPHHHHHGLVYPTAAGTLISSRAPPQLHHQMIIPYSIGAHSHSGPSESDDQEDGGGSGGGGGAGAIRAPHHQAVKKRFRTKFTQEQKEKMFSFAEKVGWKIQKQEESVVQQFCQEIGVKRRVLKVWMHNNKHNLAKKNPSDNNTPSSLN
ncbi:zinc-finger homeodomain protein 4 [Eucalyptus grandis]|uniref:zinc-finger homeodomain protein 4 n=1 Tax=Eucalyptus grandis TaxID=71139 RepID=UPI00192E95D9|nr:zinc-finger homeodomain protein 4 [Eucalyptus grandis]